MKGVRLAVSVSVSLGSTPLKLISEYSSLMVGSRQSLWPPTRNVPARSMAWDSVSLSDLSIVPSPLTSGDCVHMSPVTRSLIVPSPLSL
jgi:hypothetical protein